MPGNEILLNMQFSDHFRPTEITSSLMALTRIPEQKNFDWESHRYVSNAIDKLIENLPHYKKSQIVQTGLILDRLRIQNDSIFFS